MAQVAETTIRVPHDLKDELNEIKRRFYGNTPHEAIRGLLMYYHRSEQEKIDLEEQHDKEIRELEARTVTMIDIGVDMKSRFSEIKKELGLKTDVAVIEFLSECYLGTLQLPMCAFDTYKKLKMEGK